MRGSHAFNKSSTVGGQLLRSLLVSMFAFSIDFGVLALLTEIVRLHYLVSAAFSFILGTTVSYLLSILWVFDRRRYSSPALEYAVFVLVGVVGLGLNEAFLWAITEMLGIYYLVSKIIAASLVFFWNFAARRFILFRGPRSPSSADPAC
ncbi:MAG: GtrA family protein [Spirochaetia bacterium]|jgi:putative flippase GtrA